MDGTFVEALAKKFAGPITLETESGPVTVAPQGWQEILPKQFAPEVLATSTLRSVVDYLSANKDRLTLEEIMVQVVSPTVVRVIGALEPEAERFRRRVYLTATAAVPAIPFGSYIDSESFGIILRTAFVESATTTGLLTLLATIRESDVRETADDGLAQEVKTARGVALVDRTKVPSPVVLSPYRTFLEVDHPASPFVLRLRSGRDGDPPTCALFEADGGAWRLEAIKNLTDWLGGEIDKIDGLSGVRIIA
jgi:hypothetical protein